MADINITWILACNMLIQVPRIYNEVLNKDSVLASLVKSVKSDPNSVKVSQSCVNKVELMPKSNIHGQIWPHHLVAIDYLIGPEFL